MLKLLLKIVLALKKNILKIDYQIKFTQAFPSKCHDLLLHVTQYDYEWKGHGH